jgi:hypothetical protein
MTVYSCIWCADSYLNGPAIAQPATDGTGAHASLFRPLSDRSGNSLCGKATNAPIGGLLSRRGPTDVTSCVVSVVVDAIKRVPWRWSWAKCRNMGAKLREVLAPRWANTYTACAIVWPLRMPRIRASLFHIFPDFVDGRVSLTMSHAQTATAPRAPGSQFVGPHTRGASTCASTEPVWLLALPRVVLLEYRETANSFTKQIMRHVRQLTAQSGEVQQVVGAAQFGIFTPTVTRWTGARRMGATP